MKKEPIYKVVLEANNTEYKSEGETMLEALRNIPLEYNQLKTKGMLSFSKGKLKGEKFMYFMPLRVLLGGKLRKVGWARMFDHLLESSK